MYRGDRIVVYALGAPVLGIIVVVAGQHFEWIDQTQVRRFVDRATAETTRRRERKIARVAAQQRVVAHGNASVRC
jgi:hypothetical protein